jgi:hypothetical protein
VGDENGYIIIYRIDLKHFICLQHMYLPPFVDKELAMSKNTIPCVNLLCFDSASYILFEAVLNKNPCYGHAPAPDGQFHNSQTFQKAT